MGLPPFDFSAHASDVVCVAIGVDLLLPIAPAIMGRFLSGIKLDPKEIVRDKFGGLSKFLDDDDLTDLGKIVVQINRDKCKCQSSPGLGWRIFDVAFAIAGIFLLWSGWIDDKAIAKWSSILFLPAVLAVCYPLFCVIISIAKFNWSVFWARCHAKSNMKRELAKTKRSEDSDVSGFVEQVKAEIASR